jgi:hypothetical protein
MPRQHDKNFKSIEEIEHEVQSDRVKKVLSDVDKAMKKVEEAFEKLSKTH